MPNTVRALLFDLDDTLHSRNAAFNRWAQEFVRDDLGLAEDNPRYQEAIAHITDLDGCGYNPREIFFSKIKETYPYSPMLQSCVDQLIETHTRRLLAHIRPDVETLRLLTALKGAGLPFGIITNGATSRQFDRIRVLGLDRLTSCIFISEQFGRKKPDPAIFLAAASCLGYESDKILFIGDHPRNDIWGARRVGMRTAWLHLQREWPAELVETPPDYIIGSLGDLYALLNISSKE